MRLCTEASPAEDDIELGPLQSIIEKFLVVDIGVWSICIRCRIKDAESTL